MRSSIPMFSKSVKLVLFTKPHCSLCDQAKNVVQSVRMQRDLLYEEINILEERHGSWKDCYAFDVPVLHMQQLKDSRDLSDPIKLMHRFTTKDILQSLDVLADLSK